MAVEREIVESPMPQGTDEIVAYTLTTTQWGSTPTSPVVKVYDITADAYTDVTTTVMPTGSPSVVGDIITLPALKLLTAGSKYRVEIKFVISGNTFEAFAVVHGER